MKVCMVCEGCYPYTVGGVSSWVHAMIRSFPDTEFVVLAICADRSVSGRFVYDLPSNLTEVYEVYLQDDDWTDRRSISGGGNRRRDSFRLSNEMYDAFRSLIMNRSVRWDMLFDFFQHDDISVNDLLMGTDFLHIAEEYYSKNYPQLDFSDFLWTLRSIYLPMFLVMRSEIPQADLYHCVATGYAGLLGAMAQHRYGCGLLVSEHGIYTREREEELIRAKWVRGIYKNIWIEQFYKMSRLAYDRADLVTSLFVHARELQIELGCQPDKIRITPNGVDPDRFQNLPGKQDWEKNTVNIGAVLRVTPIKDVKTLIRAFAYAWHQDSRLRLWIMGPVDEEPEYTEECIQLVRTLEIPYCVEEKNRQELQTESALIFTGRVDVTDYLGRMDYTVLTSISEGQPLTILESYAAHKPVIATDVGNCRGLIYGEEDDFGNAGILVHVMNTEEIADAMLYLAHHPKKCEEMGENGYQRIIRRYTLANMLSRYRHIYDFLKQEN